MKTLLAVSAAVVLGSVVAHAQSMTKMESAQKGTMNQTGNEVTKAVCVLMSPEGGEVQGTVTFEAVDGGIRVVADVSGLSPGKHGFHIHEYGDCSSPNFKSAGSHLMAPGEKHAGLEDPNRHIGDMGNLVANDKGYAHLTFVDDKLSFSGPYSIIGRAVIVHEDADDLSTQPTGNAGGRVACGTIGVAKP